VPKPHTVPLVVSPSASVSDPSQTNDGSPSSSPRPAPSPTLQKRTFSAAYKLQIVEELTNAPPGKIAEVLRREGLYSSHLTQWRRALGVGGPAALQPKKTGRPGKPSDTKQVERLQRKNEQLERELALARKLIDLQKKVSEILDLTLPESELP
jgi:transposase-like protein